MRMVRMRMKGNRERMGCVKMIRVNSVKMTKRS